MRYKGAMTRGIHHSPCLIMGAWSLMFQGGLRYPWPLAYQIHSPSGSTSTAIRCGRQTVPRHSDSSFATTDARNKCLVINDGAMISNNSFSTQSHLFVANGVRANWYKSLRRLPRDGIHDGEGGVTVGLTMGITMGVAAMFTLNVIKA